MTGAKRKSFVGRLASISTLLLFNLAGATYGQQIPADEGEAPPVLSDRNQSGVADELERKLETAPANERFDVVATFQTPGGLGVAQQAIGGFEVRREFHLISGFAATLTAGQIRGLSRAPGILRIEEDVEVTTQMDAARRDFGVEAAWSRFGVDGGGTVICVVDTGVHPNHEQLNSKSLLFFDAVNGQSVAYDDNGHGTHVAAIAAGDGTGGSNAPIFQGVAPAADVYAAKVLDSSGSGSLSQVIAGVEWCADRPAVDVVNLSLGTAGGSDGGDSLSQAVNAAVQNKGKIVVVAAGNSGDAEESVGSPGAAEHAITVGAAAEWSAPVGTNRHSMGVYLAPFSSRGPTLDGRLKPDVVAPGHSIRSAQSGTTNGYVTFSGTSMASPFAAGAIALALSANSFLTPVQAKALLTATAQDRGPEGPDHDWGAGLIDAAELVAGALGSAGDQPTAFPSHQRIPGSVADHSLWSHSFEVGSSELHIPIGATLIIDGELSCSFFLIGFCWAWEWSPDLDARLIDPAGNVLFTSECPAFGECAGVGRQETLRAMPTTAGWYTIEVWPYSGSPNDGKGGTFAVDLSTGPLADIPPPEPEPVDNPPSASIAAPEHNSEVSGVVLVQVAASDDEDDAGTLIVEVAINDSWQGASYNNVTEFYEFSWNSDSAAGETVQIGARATDSADNTTNADSIQVQVSAQDPEPEPEPEPDPEPQSVHVANLSGSSAPQGRNNWRATVAVTVRDDQGAPASGATVHAAWSAGGGRNFNCTTDGDGTCSITSGNISVQVSSVTFTVQDVVHSSLAYEPGANVISEIAVQSP